MKIGKWRAGYIERCTSVSPREIKDIEITYSGEKSVLGGCNTGAVLLFFLGIKRDIEKSNSLLKIK